MKNNNNFNEKNLNEISFILKIKLQDYGLQDILFLIRKEIKKYYKVYLKNILFNNYLEYKNNNSIRKRFSLKNQNYLEILNEKNQKENQFLRNVLINLNKIN